MNTLSRYSIIISCLTIFAGGSAHAEECWKATNIKGMSAMSFDHFAFSQDGLPNEVTICFGDKFGFASSSDLGLARVGHSTLIAINMADSGMEVLNTYQIDRARGKLFYTASRINTGRESHQRPDYVAAFIGDAKRQR